MKVCGRGQVTVGVDGLYAHKETHGPERTQCLDRKACVGREMDVTTISVSHLCTPWEVYQPWHL